MLLADPMSRLSRLPSKETMDLHKVCLVRFSDVKVNALKQDTSSDPENPALREIIYSGVEVESLLLNHIAAAVPAEKCNIYNLLN